VLRCKETEHTDSEGCLPITTIFVSSIDLKHAFWQVELDEKSRPMTAITIPGRPLYQFRQMPFDLCNSDQRLCRVMNKLIPHILRSRVFAYLLTDDIQDFRTTLHVAERSGRVFK